MALVVTMSFFLGCQMVLLLVEGPTYAAVVQMLVLMFCPIALWVPTIIIIFILNLRVLLFVELL